MDGASCVLNVSGQNSVQDGVTVVSATYDNSKAVKAIVSLLSSENTYVVKLRCQTRG